MSGLLHRIGYYLAALIASTLPPAIFYWFLIHPFAAFWRRRGKALTFTIVGAVCLALAALLWRARDSLLAVHWGYHWPLMVLGAVLYALAILGERSIRRHLEWKTLVGTPEIDAAAPSRLLTDGPYARCRNPRYGNILVAMLGLSLVLNYPVLYLELLLAIPAIYLLVLLEERELARRFGDEWESYRRNVPRFLPRGGWIG